MNHSHQHGQTGNLKIAFLLNLGFVIFEIVGGLWINSVAILSDALHDLGDSISLGLAWFLARYAEKAEDEKYTYGYRRFSLLGALINAVILIVGSLLILVETIPRLMNPEPFNAAGMVLLAVVGIAVNGFAAMRLRGGESANVQVIGWHLLEDVLGWAVVLVVGLVSLVVDLPLLDPILSILIMLYILYHVIGKLKGVLALFLQAVPPHADMTALRQRLLSIEGVRSVHHLHLWSLDGEHDVFTTHIVVASDTSRDEVRRVRQEARAIVHEMARHIEHTTIEVEYEDDPPH